MLIFFKKKLTFRALGRTHLESTTNSTCSLNAMFQLNSWIPLGRAGSKLAVRNAKNPELPDGSAMGPTQSQPKPSYHQSHSTGPRGRQASGIQPLEPLLLPKLRSFFADFPWSHCSRGPEAIHLGVLMRISVRSVRQGRWSQGDLP